jgi:lysyl-tRNA synthetase class 2
MKPEKNIDSLTLEEKNLFGFVKQNKFSLLSEIKEKVSLSNKKWDKAVKGLVEKKLVKVIKNEEGLFIELVQ